MAENEKTPLTVGDMLLMQERLQAKYKAKWEPISPQTGQNKLLWMLGEVGEVIDIIKKKGGDAITADPDTRRHFVEEMADVLMYYHDVMLCYGITEEELKQAYTEKFATNMTRW